MKVLYTAALVLGIQSTAAFVAGPSSSRGVLSSPTALNGFFGDLFDAEKRKEREAAREREIEEQMAYQREIMERRENPEKMEEVRIRRAWYSSPTAPTGELTDCCSIWREYL